MLALLWAWAPAQAAPLKLTIDASAARAVLDALDSTTLTADQARAIARLPGNQGLIRKSRSYGNPADDESFAAALVAAAHGDDKAADPSGFNFAGVRRQSAVLRRVLAELEDRQTGLIEAAKRRIADYTPAGLDTPITGYLVVGGTSGGFAFGDPQFYLNLGYFPDARLATTILEHELYHAIQGAAASPARQARVSKCLARARIPAHLTDLFGSLAQEGTASAVGDVLALPKDGSGTVAEERRKFARNVGLVSRSVALLELSVHALATRAIDYDSVYALGFYGDEILYALGYVMAKAIEREQGPKAIAALLADPTGAGFINRYRRLKAYGTTDDTPKLGRKTLAWAQRMAVCAR
ncbi:DUF5700 domain-containing putative Zn-dependent protease [Sphingomonas sp.]|uniref:DUF5700 domain-containing putative Zn-dependent protease n=1 Tax=Sphingomonas sp. TaxID=28214 RepID=UPI0025D6315B|nr:DUF5700 domain-containing putative Zn-dependent protease [Sphingomonas sp.]